MTHPEELLAGYVDGTLTEKERAVVESHLPTCETCREEVALARAAIPTLAALPEEPVPLGVTGPVLAEARRRGERRAGSRFGRLQWGLGLAAAAALVVALAVTLPNLGGGENATRAQGGGIGAGAASSPKAAQAPDDALAALHGLEHQSIDYDQASVQALAGVVAREGVPFGEGEIAPSASPTPAPVAQNALTDPTSAIRCLRSSGAEISAGHQLVRLIDASYEGTPAYLGVFLEGPGAGQAADTVVIWIVAKQTCEILDLASKHI